MKPPAKEAQTFTVREWRSLPIGGDGIPEAAAQRLLALAKRETTRLRVSTPVLKLTADGAAVEAGQVVGVLSVPGARLEILPKVDGSGDATVRRALVRMLAVAWDDMAVSKSEPALLSTQREDLLEVLVRLFADRLLGAVRRGLPHRYRIHEEDLPMLRGKLDVHRQFMRHIVRPDRLACIFDDFSVDTPLNRVLKAAVVRLSGATRSASNARLLAELSARFEFVGRSASPAREPVRLDRTNTAFHWLYRVALMFLSGDWQTTTSGLGDGIALLFPMNDLFEAFVGRTMKAALAPRRVDLQARRYALESEHSHRMYELRPDIVLDGDIVLDTKWKSLRTTRSSFDVLHADVTQMLAYAAVYQARRIVLLYPWQNDLDGPAGVMRRWHIAGSSTPFDIATVDVARPDSVADTLRAIAEYRQDGTGQTVAAPPVAVDNAA